MNKVKFNGIQIYTGGIDQISSDIDAQLSTQKAVRIHLCNAYTLALSSENHELWSVLYKAELNLPDGLPLAKIVSPFHDIQIRGMDLVRLTLDNPNNSTKLHLFYGLSADKVDKFGEHLTNNFGSKIKFHILGAPFANIENLNLEELKNVVRQSKPDYIWIGLGTPKQDFLVEKLYEWVTHPCAIIPVGAVFDFLLSTNLEAPKILRKIGFEWIYRWLKEPRRLTKRYTWYNLIFLFQIGRFLVRKLYRSVNRF